ncbi:MAG TPA: glycosyltransferase family 2 protein [Gemmatimonadales bacterium]|nr:glycosyltransferase family 2 protein [Gemmatimonadales bacterium]
MSAPGVRSPARDGTRGDGPLVSIVVPAYFEEGNLARLHSELVRALASESAAWELIVVDDGSADGTWGRIRELAAGDARVRGVRLSRNFGHQYALLAGLAHAGGEAVVTMDADLQHPPAVIPRLLEAWRNGAKIVHTVRTDSDDVSWIKGLSSRAFYRVFSFLSGVPIAPGMADFRLLDRQVVGELLQFREEGLFLRGLVEWVGYPSARVPFQAEKRYSGATKYGLRRMLKFAWSGITSFSVVPLRAGIVLGLVTSAFAFGNLVYAVWAKLFEPERVEPGWATIVSLISLLFGILFVLIGILGEYLGRVLMQVRRRPLYLVSERQGFEAPAASAEQTGARGDAPRLVS